MKLPLGTESNIQKFALRPALLIGLLLGILELLLLHLITGEPITGLLLYGFLTALFSGLTAYYIFNAYHKRRLDTLRHVLQNITDKEFRNYSYLDIQRRDEIDEALREVIQASSAMETEFEKMAETENYRKEFIGDISHELKTPIFAIQGFIETLLDGAMEDEKVNRQFLEKTMRHVNRLIYLTQDLMEISRLESGELESNFQSIYLLDLIRDVMESLQHKADQAGITLESDPVDPDLTVYADRHQIRRVLTNLVDNAIKYNRKDGRVTIGVETYSSGNKHKRVLVYVEDTGFGLDDEEIERVTERFYRVDKSRSREQGGTGLGLAIVKHIMEVHGEELFIESTPGEGSTFSFTLTEVHYPSV